MKLASQHLKAANEGAPDLNTGAFRDSSTSRHGADVCGINSPFDLASNAFMGLVAGVGLLSFSANAELPPGKVDSFSLGNTALLPQVQNVSAATNLVAAAPTQEELVKALNVGFQSGLLASQASEQPVVMTTNSYAHDFAIGTNGIGNEVRLAGIEALKFFSENLTKGGDLLLSNLTADDMSEIRAFIGIFENWGRNGRPATGFTPLDADGKSTPLPPEPTDFALRCLFRVVSPEILILKMKLEKNPADRASANKLMIYKLLNDWSNSEFNREMGIPNAPDTTAKTQGAGGVGDARLSNAAIPASN